jgi:Mg/Co/Ni transporter MgtE
MQRVPWLVGLMMVQSVSSVVLQRYEGLIEANVIIASYLTMLVGGGGNAAVQVVTDIVRRTAIASGDTAANPQLLRTLGRELALAIFVAPTLAGVSYLRVRYLGVRASAIDSLAIALSYLAIIGVAVVTGVAVTFLLQRFGTSKLAATGAAPTTQVLVDVLGIVVVVLICEGLLGQEAPDDFCEQCGEVGGVSCIDVARCNVTDIATVGMATP